MLLYQGAVTLLYRSSTLIYQGAVALLSSCSELLSCVAQLGAPQQGAVALLSSWCSLALLLLQGAALRSSTSPERSFGLLYCSRVQLGAPLMQSASQQSSPTGRSCLLLTFGMRSSLQSLIRALQPVLRSYPPPGRSSRAKELAPLLRCTARRSSSPERSSALLPSGCSSCSRAQCPSYYREPLSLGQPFW